MRVANPRMPELGSYVWLIASPCRHLRDDGRGDQMGDRNVQMRNHTTRLETRRLIQCFLSNAHCINDSMRISDCSATFRTLRSRVVCRSRSEDVVKSSLISMYPHLGQDRRRHMTSDTKRLPVGRRRWWTAGTEGTDR